MKNQSFVKVGLAQINPIVGDIGYNVDKIKSFIEKGRKKEVSILAFGELSVCGYPPEDLIYKQEFIVANKRAIEEISESCEDITVIIGYIEEGPYNSIGIIHNKKLVGTYRKTSLPNYGVFDEKRYFKSGSEYIFISKKNFKVGFSICEDLWESDESTKALAEVGCSLILNINASPFSVKKEEDRLELLKKRCEDYGCGFGYVNLVGGQDELVFDGKSLFMSHDGTIQSKAKSFEEDLLILDYPLEEKTSKENDKTTGFQIDFKVISEPERKEKYIQDATSLEDIYSALKLGLKDYIRKTGFSKVVLGLSGGIDSALVAAIAKDALGSENVKVVLMTSPYTSKASVEDAKVLAKNLNIETFELPIIDTMNAYKNALSGVFKNEKVDITEENIQARIRGNFLMALSNKFGWIVIATGNKSEMSVGYSTLYGDMSGGIALIKDVPKTVVYALCRWINRDKEIIPSNIIMRPPSAELRADQTDQDDLPSYEVIDRIIELYIEKDYGIERIIKEGIKEEDVRKVVRLIDLNEYKRRQAPIGIKITEKSFGKERRMPIVNGFRA